jgi:hypothetical protein
LLNLKKVKKFVTEGLRRGVRFESSQNKSAGGCPLSAKNNSFKSRGLTMVREKYFEGLVTKLQKRAC